jgi:hypothetical protein
LSYIDQVTNVFHFHSISNYELKGEIQNMQMVKSTGLDNEVGQGVLGIRYIAVFKSGIRYIYIILVYLGYLNFENFWYKVSQLPLTNFSKKVNVCRNLYQEKYTD